MNKKTVNQQAMNKALTQAKREFWEFHGSFVRAPLVLGGVIMALLLLGVVPAQDRIGEAIQHIGAEVTHADTDVRGRMPTGELFAIQPDVLRHGLATIYTVFAFVLVLVLQFYFVDTLYSDRRDQSILFWKSLPVSERQNVLTKLFAGIAGAPLFYGAAAIVTGAFAVVVLGVYAGFFWNVTLPSASEIWQTYLLSTVGLVLGWWFLVLWLLPVFCWLLFFSALANKAPFLVALAVVIGVIVLEGWLLGTAHVAGVVKQQINVSFEAFENMLHHPEQFLTQLMYAATAASFWGGLILSAALLAASIWLRRFRWEI